MRPLAEYFALLTLTATLWWPAGLVAQNNLSVQYSNSNSVPDALTVCGSVDTAQVTITLSGQSPATRSQLTATCHLFQGIRFAGLDTSATTPGVTLLDDTNPNVPVFALPDLSPDGITHVQIGYYIYADCEVVDTLAQNGMLDLYDLWQFDYSLNGQYLSEQHTTASYRDALAIPFFTISTPTDIPPMATGDCSTRQLVISNSALNGSTDTLWYTTIQGSGLSLQLLEVNGMPIDLQAMAGPFGDTSYTAALSGEVFVANSYGNGDTTFDPNEALTITEHFRVVDCTGGTESTHAIGWGCSGQLCAQATIVDVVPIGEGSPKVAFSTGGSLANTYGGYCADGHTTITISNDGIEFDPGFGAMYDLWAGIGLGGTFSVEDGRYRITSLRIAGQDLNVSTYPLLALHGHPAFATDPDGTGGLADLDGDGWFDDLPVGQSIELTAFYEVNCTAADMPTDDAYNSNFGTAFHGRIRYTDACQQTITAPHSNFFTPTLKRNSFSNPAPPDAFVLTDTFTLRHRQNRTARFFEPLCDGQGHWIVKVHLPQGIHPIIDQVSWTHTGGEIALPSSYEFEDSLLTLTFGDSTISSFNGDFELNLPLVADCSAAGRQANVTLDITYVCPTCDCIHNWYCGTIEGPQIHANSPPCPPEVLICESGLRTYHFDVARTTFGFADPNFQTPIDPDQANKKVAISCDSVLMQVRSVVGNVPLDDSIGIAITYDNPDGTDDVAELFLFGHGQVIFTTTDSTYLCALNSSQLTIHHMGARKMLQFDLTPCLDALGLTLMPGDSLDFYATFQLNPDGPYELQFRQVPQLRAWAFAQIGGQTYRCDHFGTDFTVAKTRTVFDYPNSSAFPKGCDSTTLDYRLIVANNGFNNWFTGEYRQAMHFDSITFDFEPSILQAFEGKNVAISIPGHPYFHDQFFDLPPLDSFPDGHYIVRFDTLNFSPSLNVVQNYAMHLRITLQPHCQTALASTQGNGIFQFAPRVWFEDRSYAAHIGSGSCVAPKMESAGNLLTYTDPPALSISALTSTQYELIQDTACWTVQVCNTSTESHTGVVWLSLDDPTHNAPVVAVYDHTLPDTAWAIPIFESPDGRRYWLSSPLSPATPQYDYADICRVYRIETQMEACIPWQGSIVAGWSCEPVLLANMGATIDTSCPLVQLPVAVLPQMPFIEADMVDQPLTHPDICDTTVLTILLRNTDRGTAYDLTTDLFLPLSGATLLAQSIEVAWPANANFQAVVAAPEFMGHTARGQHYRFNGFDALHPWLAQYGLPGFNPDQPSDSNELRLRFAFVTDCAFRSGDLAYYQFEARNGCDQPSNFEAGESFPLFIAGAEPPLDQLYQIELLGSSPIVPQAPHTLHLQVRKLTAAPADTTAHISITLPAGATYIVGSTQGLSPGFAPSDPEIQVQGAVQTLLWPLPATMVQDETVQLSFSFTAPEFPCTQSQAELALAVLLRRELYCSSEESFCEVATIVSAGGTQLITLPITSNVSLSVQQLRSSCTDLGEQINGQIQFSSAALDLAGHTFTLELLFDANGNAQPDSTDLILLSQEVGPLLGNGDTVSWHALLSPQQACNLIVVAHSADSAVCGLPWLALPSPVLTLGEPQHIYCGPGPDTLWLYTDSCSLLNQYSISWTTASPQADLLWIDSSGTTAQLVVSYNHTSPDTIMVLRHITRPQCEATTTDTLRLIRSGGVSLEIPPSLFVLPGDSILLPLEVSGGLPPYQIDWQPDSTLSNGDVAQPIAFPDQPTTYTATVTDLLGCTAQTQVQLLLQNPIVATLTPTDTAICAGTPLAITGNGGDHFYWFESHTNAQHGTLSDSTGAQITFLAQAPGTYTIGAIATDEAFPGFSDTAFATIVVHPLPYFTLLPPDSTCIDLLTWLALSDIPDTANYLINWQPSPTIGQGTPTVAFSTNDTLNVSATVSTPFGCSQTQALTLVPTGCNCSLSPTDTVYLQASACTYSADLCLPIGPGLLGRYAFTVDGQPWSMPLHGCSFQFQGVYTWATLFGQGQAGTYLVEAWPVGNDTFSFSFESIDALIDSMNLFDNDGQWQADPNGGPFIIGGTPNVSYGPMQVILLDLNISNTLGFNQQYLPTAFALPLTTGLHTVIATDTLSTCSDTIQAWVWCTLTDTLSLQWPLNLQDTFCLSANELAGPLTQALLACPPPTNAQIQLVQDSCLLISPQQLGTDTFCIIFCDSLAICDTTVIVLQIVPDPLLILKDTIIVGQQGSWCVDTSVLDLSTSPTAMYSACPTPVNTVGWNIDSLCLFYQGLQVGTDTTCLSICDSLNTCDTLLFAVTVLSGQIVYDTIRLGYDTTLWCFDTTQLIGPKQLEVQCSPPPFPSVQFELDTTQWCVQWSGLQVGTDTTCTLLSDSIGQAIRTYFIVTVIDIQPQIICDTVFVGMTRYYCLDTSELPGTVQSFDDACASLNGQHVDFFFLQDSLCVEYTGLSEGQDSACFVLCDASGICDTTYFCISVAPYHGPPKANNDLFCHPGTPMGTPIVLDILANDTIYGGLQHIEILTQPESGDAVAILNLDRSTTLIPDPPFCARIESFTYRVCNPIACDTATVQVCIECLDVQPFSAVSPNNDGYNDTFYIGRIEDFPDNYLRIYNRWGQLVYEQRGYQNDWPGIWNEDKQLPDGTYFFILEYDDGGVRKVLRGFFELFR